MKPAIRSRNPALGLGMLARQDEQAASLQAALQAAMQQSDTNWTFRQM
jgi:hypothetical protein